MTKLTALITSLVLGTSSAAMADTALGFRPAVRDQRTPAPGAYRAPWIALSQPMMLDHDGRNSVRLATPSRYSQLRLQSTAGASYIKSIVVRFADGTRQEIPVNRSLDKRTPMVNLNVSNRAAVERVMINGSTNRRASVQLFGVRSQLRR